MYSCIYIVEEVCLYFTMDNNGKDAGIFRGHIESEIHVIPRNKKYFFLNTYSNIKNIKKLTRINKKKEEKKPNISGHFVLLIKFYYVN